MVLVEYGRICAGSAGFVVRADRAPGCLSGFWVLALKDGGEEHPGTSLPVVFWFLDLLVSWLLGESLRRRLAKRHANHYMGSGPSIQDRSYRCRFRLDCVFGKTPEGSLSSVTGIQSCTFCRYSSPGRFPVVHDKNPNMDVLSVLQPRMVPFCL